METPSNNKQQKPKAKEHKDNKSESQTESARGTPRRAPTTHNDPVF